MLSTLYWQYFSFSQKMSQNCIVAMFSWKHIKNVINGKWAFINRDTSHHHYELPIPTRFYSVISNTSKSSYKIVIVVRGGLWWLLVVRGGLLWLVVAVGTVYKSPWKIQKKENKFCRQAVHITNSCKRRGLNKTSNVRRFTAWHVQKESIFHTTNTLLTYFISDLRSIYLETLSWKFL